MLNMNSNRDGHLGNWARACDSCHAAACTLYCHTDSAYLCNHCDESIHSANPIALQHERIWVRTACENAPAAFTCQADAASLCSNCDIKIHSANPLARRHTQVPIPPLSRVAYASSTSTYLEELGGLVLDTENEIMLNNYKEELEKDETDSWLVLDLDNNDTQTNSGFTFGEEVSEYLDLVEYNSCAEYQSQEQNDHRWQLSSVHRGDNGNDSIVPVQSFEEKVHRQHQHQQKQQQQQQKQKQQQQQQHNIYVDRDYEASKAALFNNTSSGQRNQVSVPFINAGYVLKATTNDISNSYSRYPKGTMDLFPTSPLLMPLQFTLTNREARVLRYREKRKARKFEKKIRYASRKANAETRPRVKGRFVRKTDMEFKVDQIFLPEDYGYGIVPSR